MSAILDAIKKADKEKQAAQQPIDLEVPDAVAERDLVGPSVYTSSSSTSRVVLIAASSALITVLISAGIIYALSNLNGSQLAPITIAATQSAPLASTTTAPQISPTTSASALAPLTPEPQPQQILPESPTSGQVPTPVQQTPSEQNTAQTPVVTAKADLTPRVSPAPVPPPRPVKPIEVIAPKAAVQEDGPANPAIQSKSPDVVPKIVADPEIPVVEAIADKKKDPDFLQENRPPKLDGAQVRALPLLGHDARERYGLEKLEVNIVGEPNERQPLPFAILNLQQVFVGNLIPKTDARLIGVCADGIGIEIISTGGRFLIPH
jgi:hypothetical protein